MSYHPYGNARPNNTARQGYSSYESNGYPGAAAAGPSYPYGAASSYDVQVPVGYDAAAQYDASLAEQASIYTPQAAAQPSSFGKVTDKGKGRTTVLRKGGGQVWEDKTLLEWDPSHFRLFVGDLDPALSDDVFAQAFSNARYPSFVKAKLVRDKHTNKGKGYGFVSYRDPEDFLKAWKEMNGKYVGTRPVKISKATAGVNTVEIGAKKARNFDLKAKAKTGTEAFSRAKIAEAEGGGLNKKEGAGPKDKKSYIRR